MFKIGQNVVCIIPVFEKTNREYGFSVDVIYTVKDIKICPVCGKVYLWFGNVDIRIRSRCQHCNEPLDHGLWWVEASNFELYREEETKCVQKQLVKELNNYEN